QGQERHEVEEDSPREHPHVEDTLGLEESPAELGADLAAFGIGDGGGTAHLDGDRLQPGPARAVHGQGYVEARRLRSELQIAQDLVSSDEARLCPPLGQSRIRAKAQAQDASKAFCAVQEKRRVWPHPAVVDLEASRESPER